MQATFIHGQAAPASPYSTYNVDAAIVHLERVLLAEAANSLFGQTYWRARAAGQRMRLERLMKLLSESAALRRA